MLRRSLKCSTYLLSHAYHTSYIGCTVTVYDEQFQNVLAVTDSCVDS